MLQRLSISLVQFFLTEAIITEEDQDVYRYSVEILLSSLAVYGSILLLALWGQLLPETIAYYCGFLLIRHSAGGYHARSHGRCILLTLVVYLLSITLLSAIPQQLWIEAVVLMAALSLGAIYRFGPVDHVNKPFTPEEHRRYRQQSLVLVTLISLISIMMVALSLQEKWALAISLGMVSASLSVIAGNQEVNRHVQSERRL